MRALRVKLLRDLARLKGQAIATGLVMACGISTFVMSLSLLDSLRTTLDGYYQRNRFAEVFTHVKRAPLSLAPHLSSIPGVAQMQARIVESVRLDLPDLEEPASGRIVSLGTAPAEGLNQLYLREGRFPERDSRSHEVLVSQRFAEAHGLRPGDQVPAVLNGRTQQLRVVGIAMSPEYIYLISPGSVFPEKSRYAIFWMARDEMEAVYDMDGAFNDVTLTLAPGASKAEVIERLDELTKPYGGLGAYGREDQLSNKFVENEIRELRGMTLIVPVIFLSVSAFLLNIVLARMIATQREQVATLKALGYTRTEIARHYLSFVMMIVFLAALLGTLLGAAMGRSMTGLYTEFFDFPSFVYLLRPRVVLLAVLVSVLSASVGVLHALRGAVALAPAEAMRPAAPPSYRPTLLERLGLNRWVTTPLRMVLRQLENRPVRTALSVLGVALATAILVLGTFNKGAIDYVLDFEYNQVQRLDMDIVFFDQTDMSALSSIAHMTGVRRCEPYRALSVRMRSDQVSRRLGITGLTRPDGLYRLTDLSGEPVGLPEHGLVISSMLAKTLGVGVGDSVTIEALEGRRPTFEIRVSGLMDAFSGLAAYMSLEEMNRLMGEPDSISGVYILSDPAHAASLSDALKRSPAVAAVNLKSATVENFRRTIDRNIAIVRPFVVAFAVIIAFGVVYNSARVSLSERSRDLATLRVLGYTRSEISRIQLGELGVITAMAIPIGLVIGCGLAWFTTVMTASELVRIPFVTLPSIYVFAAFVTALASTVSGLVVRRRLDRLDLLSVLKARE